MTTALSLLAVHFVGALAYVAWATRQVAAGAPAWHYVLAAPLLYAFLVLLVTLADFMLAWLWRTPRPPDARIGTAATLRMIGHEFMALLPSAFRMMAFRYVAPWPLPQPADLPVVLVHGVLCNAGVWGDMLAGCRRRGIDAVYTLSYSPPLASIERFAGQLAACIDRALADTGACQVVVVGHSMGGLVARAYVARHGGAKVAQVITLGTPYHGSKFASLMVGADLTEMRPGSRWLATLPALPATPAFVALWSWHDSMVAPQASARLEGARNIALTGIGHNTLLHDPQVIERVTDELLRARAAVASRPASR